MNVALLSEEEIASKYKDYSEPDGWMCPVCMFLFDHKDNRPMRISEGFDDKFERDDPRGTKIGCKHVFCDRCANRLLTSHSDCYLCRGHVKLFVLNLELLNQIVAFMDGHYVGLAAQLNALSWEKEKGRERLEKLQAESANIEGFKRDLKFQTGQNRTLQEKVHTLEASLRTTTTLRDNAQATLATATTRYDQVSAELRKCMAINALLFDEVIDLKLARLNEGSIRPQDLGLSLSQNGDLVLVDVQLDQKKQFLASEGKTKKQKTAPVKTKVLTYGRSKSSLAKSDHIILKRIRLHEEAKRAHGEGELGEGQGLEERLPSEQEVEESYVEIAVPGQGEMTLVQRDTWLYRFIQSRQNSAESLFEEGDGASNGEDEKQGKLFQVVNKLSLDAALGAHRRLAAVKTAKVKPRVQKPAVVVAALPLVAAEKGKEEEEVVAAAVEEEDKNMFYPNAKKYNDQYGIYQHLVDDQDGVVLVHAGQFSFKIPKEVAAIKIPDTEAGNTLILEREGNNMQMEIHAIIDALLNQTRKMDAAVSARLKHRLAVLLEACRLAFKDEYHTTNTTQFVQKYSADSILACGIFPSVNSIKQATKEKITEWRVALLTFKPNCFGASDDRARLFNQLQSAFGTDGDDMPGINAADYLRPDAVAPRLAAWAATDVSCKLFVGLNQLIVPKCAVPKTLMLDSQISTPEYAHLFQMSSVQRYTKIRSLADDVLESPWRISVFSPNVIELTRLIEVEQYVFRTKFRHMSALEEVEQMHPKMLYDNHVLNQFLHRDQLSIGTLRKWADFLSSLDSLNAHYSAMLNNLKREISQKEEVQAALNVVPEQSPSRLVSMSRLERTRNNDPEAVFDSL